MKQTWRKTLSLLLCLCLCLSFLPSAFASEEPPVPAEEAAAGDPAEEILPVIVPEQPEQPEQTPAEPGEDAQDSLLPGEDAEPKAPLSTIDESENGVVSFTTYGELEELCQRSYDAQTTLWFKGEGSLNVSGPLALPENTSLRAGSLVVEEGGVLRLRGTCVATELTIRGTVVLVDGGAIWQVRSFDMPGGSVMAEGENSSRSSIDIIQPVASEAELSAALERLAGYNNPLIYMALQANTEPVTITGEMILPENCSLSVNGSGSLIIDPGAALTVNNELDIPVGNVSISGRFVNNGTVHIWSGGTLTLEDGGACEGAGYLVVNAGSSSYMDCLPGFEENDLDVVAVRPNNVYQLAFREPGTPPRLAWEYNSATRTLTVTGSGAMEDFPVEDGQGTPWYAYRSEIEHVVFDGDFTSIGAYACYDMPRLQSVSMPDSVEAIGTYAFASTPALTAVQLPDSLSAIDEAAFYGCGLTGVSFPEGLSYVGRRAFLGSGLTGTLRLPGSCYELYEACFADTAVEKLVLSADFRSTGNLNSAFQGCDQLKAFEVEEGNSIFASVDGVIYSKDLTELRLVPPGYTGALTVPGSVTWIGSNSARNVFGLTAAYMPEGVTRIDYGAFANCRSMTEVAIPASMTNIGYGAFEGCDALETVTYGGESAAWSDMSIANGNDPLLEAWAKVAPVTGTCGADATWSFDKETGVLTVRGTGVMDDGQPWSVFKTQISSVVIGEGITGIGQQNFLQCDKLQSVSLPDTLTDIGYNAFGQTYLEKVTVPASVTALGMMAFDRTTVLLVYEGSVAHHFAVDEGYNYLVLDPGETDRDLSDRCGPELVWTFDPDTGVLTVTGSGAMWSFGEKSPAPWDDVKDYIVRVQLPTGLTNLSPWAFNGCCMLQQVDIPDTVTSIEYGAFMSCSSLPSVDIPDSVQTIGTSAFLACSSLTEVTLPETLQGLMAGVFQNCTSLPSASLPESLSSFGSGLFNGCAALTDVALPSGLKQLPDNTFVGCSSLTRFALPEKLEKIGNGAFNGSGIRELTIPDTVTALGFGAFMHCGDLERLVVPPSVSDIEYFAFEGCDKVTVYCYKDSPAQRYCEENGVNYQLLDEDFIVVEGAVVSEEGELVEPLTVQEAGELADREPKSMTVLFQADLNGTAGQTLTFTVPGFTDTIYVYHYVDGRWTLIGQGQGPEVTVMVDSFSPFALAVSGAEELLKLMGSITSPSAEPVQLALYPASASDEDILSGAAQAVSTGVAESAQLLLKDLAAGSYKLLLTQAGKIAPLILETGALSGDKDLGQIALQLFGDTNRDGRVDALDVLNLQLYAGSRAGSIMDLKDDEAALTYALRAADVDRNGVVNAIDVLNLQLYIGSRAGTLAEIP